MARKRKEIKARAPSTRRPRPAKKVKPAPKLTPRRAGPFQLSQVDTIALISGGKLQVGERLRPARIKLKEKKKKKPKPFVSTVKLGQTSG